MLGRIKNMKWQYKVGVGVATGAAIVAGAGTAFAYFTSTGTGSGTGSVGSATNSWTVSGVAYSSGATPLYPSQAAQTWAFSIKNNTAGTLGLNNVTVTVTSGGPTTGKTCAATNFNLDGLTGTGASSDTFNAGNGMTLKDWNSAAITSLTPAAEDVPAGDTVTGTFTLAMNDDNQTGSAVAQDGCQGASPVVQVAAS